MAYITVKEASEKWNISTRRVCVLCSNGKIPGAIKRSKVWMIPSNAAKPEDGRKIEIEHKLDPSLLILNPTYFENKPNLIPTNEETKICKITELYLTGKLKEALKEIELFMNNPDNTRYLFVAASLQYVIAADLGNKEVFNNSLTLITDLVSKDDMYKNEKLIYSSYIKQDNSKISTGIIENDLFYELIPIISLFKTKVKLNDMISQGNAEDAFFLEIIGNNLDESNNPLICAYFHIYLAVFYNAISVPNAYNYHIHKATDILLPRKWYTPLAEYSLTINLEFISKLDAEAYREISKLSSSIVNSYISIGIFEKLSKNPSYYPYQNIQIALRILQGKTNKEIAEELGISLYTVKKHIDDIMAFTNSSSRKEIKQFVYRNFFI